MAAPAPEKEKKKAVAATTATLRPAKEAAAPEVAREKAEIGAMLRPGPGARDTLDVGAKSDAAEKEADAVADAILSDKPADAPAAKPSETQTNDTEDPARTFGQARAPPMSNMTTDTKIRRSTAMGGQPHLDSLSATPALPSGMADVSVAQNEDSELDQLSDSDYAVLSDGEGLQPKFLPASGNGAGFSLNTDLSRRIRMARGGTPLPNDLAQRIETRLGVDLSGVRLQTGNEARTMCAAIGARAFAYRNTIWLRSPTEVSDRRLLTHEVVHTVQQGAAPRRAPRSSTPRAGTPRARARDPRLEEARHVRHARAPPTAHPGMDKQTIQRRDSGEDAGWLARGAESVADRLDSYGVLKVLIGRRLFTGETLNPSSVDYVGAFMKFIGADETFEQMKQSGALQRGFDAIREGLTTYDITWNRVERTFARARDDFDWLSPLDSFREIFGPFFADVISYGAEVLTIIAELVAEAFVIGFGPMGRQVWEKIKAIGETIGLIISDPLAFAMNLIRAVSRGILGFGERIWEHIKSGLLAWLLGPIADMGIQLPERFDLKGIVSVILQVLGLTYPQLRPRIVRALEPNGDVKVSVVERIIEVVNILRTEGLAGIWRKLMEYIDNLQMTVINGIRDWVIRAVVQAGIRKLVAWVNPVGALLDILFTIYNLIVFFVERFQQILDFASSIFDSLGKIARGQLNDAALAVEDAMRRTIPIIIGFLTGFLGIPNPGSTIRRIITNLRASVHRAFDRLLNWIIDKVKKLIARLVDKFRRDTPTERVAFTMDGETHEMWADDGERRVNLMMASEEPGPVSEDAPQVTDAEHAASADHSDAAGAARIDALVGAQAAVAEEVDRLNALPETNRSTPQARARLHEKIALLTPLLQEASVRPDNAADIDDDSPEQVDAQDGAAALDRTDYPMRRRVRTTTAVEGAAGTWTAMTEVWNNAKSEAPNAADVYANLARDHAPEFALIARVSRMALPGLTRKGNPRTARMFPTLFNNVPNPSTDSKASNGTLPVVIIRTAINSKIGANSDLLSAWDRSFSEVRGMWVANKFSTDLSDGERAQATTHLRSTYGAEGLISDMESHVSKIKTKYSELPPQTLDDDFGAHLDNHAIPVLQQVTRNAFGGSGDGPNETEGAQSGINIPYDDKLAANELQMAPYKDLPAIGDNMQRHHLLEETIVRSFRERAKDLSVASVLGNRSEALTSQIFEAAKAGLDAEQTSKISGDADLMALEESVLSALRAAFGATALATGMRTGQGPHDNGIAINVLSSINQLAGYQPKSNIDTGLAQVETDFAQHNAGSLRAATLMRMSNAFVQIANGEGLDEVTLKGQLEGDISALVSDMQSNLDENYQAVFAALTATAWSTFHRLQTASISEIDATGDQASIDKSAPMRTRFAELTRDAVISANIAKWFETPAV